MLLANKVLPQRKIGLIFYIATKFTMKDSLKTIAIIAAMAGSTMSACGEEIEAKKGLSLDNLHLEGEKLSRSYNAARQEGNEDSAAHFYEQLGELLSKCSSGSQMNALSKVFLDSTLELQNPEADARSFVEVRKAALQTGDFITLADIDAAFYTTFQRYWEQRGEQEAETLKEFYDYGNAGACLGYEMMLAKESNDSPLAEKIRRNVDGVAATLDSRTELYRMFDDAFQSFARS